MDVEDEPVTELGHPSAFYSRAVHEHRSARRSGLGLAAIALVVLLTVSRSPEKVRDAVDGPGWARCCSCHCRGLSCAFFPPAAAGQAACCSARRGAPDHDRRLMLARSRSSDCRHGGAPRSTSCRARASAPGRGADQSAAASCRAVRTDRALSPFVVINYVSGLTACGPARSPGTLIPVIPRGFAYRRSAVTSTTSTHRSNRRVRRARGDGTGRRTPPWNGAGRPPRGRSGAALRRLRSTGRPRASGPNA